MSEMVADPDRYFGQFMPKRDPLLRDLEAEAEREKIPIVGPVVGELLFILAGAAGARRILELGTATGYSAIFLARACERNGGEVITLERDGKMAARAEANLRRAGFESVVEVRTGNAMEVLPGLEGEFDLIFIDIEKADYFRALPLCHRLLRPGGLLVADNVGFKDADPFNQAVSADPGWRSVHLFSYLPRHSPEHDGICLALRV